MEAQAEMESDCQKKQRGKNLKTKRFNFMLPDLPSTEGAGNEKIKMLIERSNPFEREMYLPQELRLFNLQLLSLKKHGKEKEKRCNWTLTTFIMGLI